LTRLISYKSNSYEILMLLYLRNLVFSVISLLLLAGCSGDDTWCLTSEKTVYSDSSVIKNVVNSIVTINGNGVDAANPSTPVGGWVYTGIPVQVGDQISISASGSILVAMPYGLQSSVDGTSNDSYIYAAVNSQDTSSYYANNGLGNKIVVLASSDTSMGLIDPSTNALFEFVNGQNIIVTTKDCATGDTSSSSPSKWTWSKWNTTTVRCSSRGTRNFTVNDPLCKAVKCCKSTLGICNNSDQWQCQAVILSDTSTRIDQCGTGAQNYNCEDNSSYTSPCYAVNKYERKSGWCGGNHKNSGISVSDDQPSCGTNSSDNVITPVINTCGNTDSCWNMGGYRMYAFPAGVSCPGDTGCVHLNNSSYIAGGKSFQSQGGAVYLKIIDENNAGSEVDTTAWQTELTNNEMELAALSITNENLTDSLYKIKGETILQDGSTATTDGQLLVINSYSDSVASIESDANKYKDGFTDAANIMEDINTSLATLQDMFGIFAGQLTLSDDPNIPWSNLSDMYGQAVAAKNLVNSLTIDGLDETTVPTLSEVNIFKPNASTTLANLVTAITDAQTTKADLDTNSASMDTLGIRNSDLSGYILEASNNGPNDAIGGYTTYGRSDPVIATDGTYLEVIASLNDPNLDDSATVDLGVVTANPKTVSINAVGNLWMRINDPDSNYNNNIGAYTVTVGKISETTGFTTIFTKIINQIKNQINASIKSMFENMTCTGASSFKEDCNDYLTLINNMLYLYMVIFGILFLFGLVKTDQLDFVIRIIKIGIIITLISPGSYDFFNDYLFNAIMSVSDTLIAAATGAPIDNPFEFLDQSIALLVLDPYTYFKIMSLMFQGLLGFVAFIMVIYGAVNFVKAVFNAMKVYVMAIVGLAICFVLAPIFIPFILFKRTVELFQNWLNAMLRFAIEPALLFIGLIFLNAMLLAILRQMFNFSACFKCTLPITFSLPGYSEIGPLTLFCIPWFSPWGVDNVGTGMEFTVFFSIPLAITFCIVTKIMEIYSKNFAQTISSAIFGASGTSMLSSKSASLSYNPFRDIHSAYKKMMDGKNDRGQKQRQGLTNKIANKAAEKMKEEEAKKNSSPPTDGSLSNVSMNAAAELTGVESENAGGRAVKNIDKNKAPKKTPKKLKAQVKDVVGDVAAGGSRGGDVKGGAPDKSPKSPKSSKPRSGALN
jgi:type IV secretory pathway VirB6-like protein